MLGHFSFLQFQIFKSKTNANNQLGEIITKSKILSEQCENLRKFKKSLDFSTKLQCIMGMLHAHNALYNSTTFTPSCIRAIKVNTEFRVEPIHHTKYKFRTYSTQLE